MLYAGGNAWVRVHTVEQDFQEASSFFFTSFNTYMHVEFTTLVLQRSESGIGVCAWVSKHRQKPTIANPTAPYLKV